MDQEDTDQEMTSNLVAIYERTRGRFRNRAFRRAFTNGVEATIRSLRNKADVQSTPNPYPDHRTDRDGVTWARAFRRY